MVASMRAPGVRGNNSSSSPTAGYWEGGGGLNRTAGHGYRVANEADCREQGRSTAPLDGCGGSTTDGRRRARGDEAAGRRLKPGGGHPRGGFMAKDGGPGTKGDDGRRRLLRCGTCDKVTDCSPGDLMHYVRQGWPQCCGETMALFIEERLSGAART